jgi:hypothetical protein
VAIVAAWVFGMQESQHLSTAQALAQLGMDPQTWVVQRAVLSVALVALSGWNRYHAPKATLADERARLERELTLDPLRQQVRAQRAIGAVGLARSALAAAAARVHDEKPPTGPGSPSVGARPDAHPDGADHVDHAPVRMVTPSGTQQRPNAARARANRRRVRTRAVTDSVEAQARASWHPGMSVTQLERAAGISRNAAQKWRRVFTAEAPSTEQIAR